jgi:hypothetical protein
MRGILRVRLFISLAVAALAAGPVAEPPAVRPIVVLVHGRGHLDADSAVLRREWKRGLDTALASVGLPALGADDLRLAWYADVLDPDFESPCDTAPAKGDSLGLDSFARVLLGALASSVPKTEAPEARALLGDLLYIIDESTRCAAERRVGTVIEAAIAQKRPVIVVAYSLGSLVAYGYLNARPVTTSQNDLMLVTLGSPLGNSDMRGLLGGGSDSLRIPAIVSAWENVYDPDDPFAAPLESVVSGRGVRDRETARPSADDSHYIGRYLRDPATGGAVGRALCVAASNPWPACSRLTAPRKL